GYSGDGGPATSAQLGNTKGIVVDMAGNVYITDSSNYRIRKVDTAGIITTMAGNGTLGYSGDGGPATSAQLGSPKGIVADMAGNIYIADSSNYRIRKVDTAGIITTMAGNGLLAPIESGQAITLRIEQPHCVLVDDQNQLYFSANWDGQVSKVDYFSKLVATVAGNGTPGFSGDGGPATSAQLGYFVRGMAKDAAGNLYLVDQQNHRIRKVNAATGIITTVAGSGTTGPSGGGYTGDGGPATSAKLKNPASIASDSGGNLYIADRENHRIRKVNAATGIITTVAGSGTTGPLGGGYTGDGGPATSAKLKYPAGVTVDSAGNLYIADTSNHCIRQVNVATGIIATVAGTGGVWGYSGDGGIATAARLSSPTGIALAASGNLYLSDQQNDRIRKLNTITGIITTVAGDGIWRFWGDGGAAIGASLKQPISVTVNAAGNLYIADYYNDRIRWIN
ncbi:MAG: hypothetical protein HY692_08020, partial [Cyanobacteria bacterium NC_groundwater_1444_Ag_S-0.65um_54_12]|nr:hypothetical protein [Cyanobacteria bacterium NC_groundwater_1444_Ag_S-0.65um_54_12]